MFPVFISATFKKKILASYRTAYSVLISIVLINYYDVVPGISYVIPLLQAILAGYPYLGMWQNDCWKGIYSTIFGVIIGVMIGFAHEYNYVVIILLLIVLTWVYRISLWDRLAQTIGALAILLGAVFPPLLGPSVVGLPTLHFTVAILLIPFAVAGLCLLFPRLSLASYAAQQKVTTLCQTLSSAVSALVKGFCAADFADLYTADVSCYS